MNIAIADPPPSISLSVIAEALDMKVTAVADLLRSYKIPVLWQEGKRTVAWAEIKSLIAFLRKRTGLQPLVEP